MKGKYYLIGVLFLIILGISVYYILLGNSFSWTPVSNKEKQLSKKENTFIRTLLNDKIIKIEIIEKINFENNNVSYIFEIYLKHDIEKDSKIKLAENIIQLLYTKILDYDTLYNIDVITIQFINVNEPTIISFKRHYAIKDLSYIFGFKIIKKADKYIKQKVII